MSMDLRIKKKNEVYLKVQAPPHINYELSDFFTFEVESAKFMQKTTTMERLGWKDKIVFSCYRGVICWSV